MPCTQPDDAFDAGLPALTGWEAEPVDPDTGDEPWPKPPRHLREQVEVIAVVAVGGVIGACARYGAGLRWPTPPGTFPWTTLWINVVGCGLMGILMVVVAERFSAPRLVRPFLGTGILGGFTTFSTYVVDTQHLFQPGTAEAGLLYLAATLLASVAAVWLGATLTRLVRRRA